MQFESRSGPWRRVATAVDETGQPWKPYQLTRAVNGSVDFRRGVSELGRGPIRSPPGSPARPYPRCQ